MAPHAASWRDFWHDAPGRRFTRRHERLNGAQRHAAARVLRALLGVLLVLVGVVFMALPGPGIVPALAGLSLLAGESRRIAQALDRLELKLRALRRRSR